MDSSESKNRYILIIGGGTFGTSSAYHLTEQGYTNVTVLDRWSPPSKEAAGNDINKIVRADYPESLYADLATESIEKWKDSNGLFSGLYHRCGWLMAAGEKSLPFIEGSIKTAGERGFEQAQALTSEEVRKRFAAYDGSMDGWKTFWNSSAGWVNARAALGRMAGEAQKKGVKYVTGATGHVVQLLFDNDQKRCVGAQSVDGTTHYADEVVLAAGAATASILDMKGQLVAKGHTVGHIQLEPHEIEKYGSMPIVDHLEGGILFPPQEDGIIKIGAVNFVTNYASSHPNVSLPRYRSDNPSDSIPKPIETHLRNWLRELAPELADRAWFETRICWDADMPDYHFLIGAHPEHAGLKLAVGGSAHGFKFLPVIGKYVVAMMEGRMDEETARKWRWRPGVKMAEGEANLHPTPLLDLNEIPGWQKDSEKARL